MIRTFNVVSIGALGSALLLTTAANAQEAADQSGALGDIVVTAQKTSSLASKTPISISVLSGEEVRATGVHDLGTLSRVEPTVSFQNSAQPAVYVGIRGVLSQSNSEIGDPAVAVGMDNFFPNRAYTINQSLYDIARIEVLRGPQGTLYGRNAIGGVINFITQQPTKEFEGFASITAGNFGTLNTEGAVNVPVSEKVQVRASWGTYRHNAYFGNPDDPQGNNRENSTSGRLIVAFQPSDRFYGSASVQYTQTGGTGATFQLIPFIMNAAGDDIRHEKPAGVGADDYETIVPFWQDIEDIRFHWGFSYEIADSLKLNYNGGYDLVDYQYQQSNTNMTTRVPTAFVQHEKPNTMSHELRLTSDASKAISFQAGLYYFREDSNLNSGSRTLYNNQWVQASLYQDPKVDTISKAVFAQVAFKPVQNLTLSAGARQTWDKRVREGIGYTYTNGVVTSTGSQDGNVKSDKLTWHVGADWNPTDTTMIYAKVDTGYKAGGFNTSGVTSYPYDEETSTVFEGGIKQQFLGRRALFSLSGFYNDYKGYQASLGLCSICNNNRAGIVNAGAAEIWGFESSFNVKVGTATNVTLSANYLSAKFTDFDATYTKMTRGNSGETIPMDLSGKYLPLAPKWTFAGNVEHVISLGDRGELVADLSAAYRSRQYFTIYNWAENTQDGYALVDASLEYRTSDDRYSVQLFVRNLGDKRYSTFSLNNQTMRAYLYSYGAPRTVGAKLTAKF